MKIIKIVCFTFLMIFTIPIAKEIDGIPIREWDSASDRARERKKFEEQKLNYQKWLTVRLDAKKLRTNSAIFPGAGQYKKNQYIKAGIFSVASIGGVVGGLLFLKSASKNYDKYKKADDVESIESYWDKTQSCQTMGMVFLSVGIVSWLVNVWDAGAGVEKANNKLLKKMLFSYDGKSVNWQLCFSF